MRHLKGRRRDLNPAFFYGMTGEVLCPETRKTITPPAVRFVSSGTAFRRESGQSTRLRSSTGRARIGTPAVSSNRLPGGGGARIPARDDRLGGFAQYGHFQSRISGMSSPYLAMYCLCSMSLSRIGCLT